MIYVLSDGTAVKIGVANDIDQRIKQLQTGNPRKIFLIRRIDFFGYGASDFDLEKALHRLFYEFRLEGEWFSSKILPKILTMEPIELRRLAEEYIGREEVQPEPRVFERTWSKGIKLRELAEHYKSLYENEKKIVEMLAEYIAEREDLK